MTEKGKADLKVGNIMLRKREREIKRTFLHPTEQLPFHFAPEEDSRTEQVSFYLSFNFHLQFTNKSKGSPMVIYQKRLTNIFHTRQIPAAAVLHISVDFFDKLS